MARSASSHRSTRAIRSSKIGEALVVVLAAPVDAILETIPQLPLVISAARARDRYRQHQARDHEGGGRRATHATSSAGTRWPAARASPMPARTCSTAVRGFSTNPDAPDAVRRAARFVEALGAKPVVLSDHGEEHDRLMAAVSHLPQVTASLLMAIVGARRRRRQSPVGRQRPARHDAAGVEPGRRCGRACWPATATSSSRC